MKPVDDDNSDKSSDLAWYCLGGFSLNELLEEPESGSRAMEILQAIADLGIGSELLSCIERKLASLAKENVLQHCHNGYETAAHVHLFCPKPAIDELTSQDYMIQDVSGTSVESTYIIHHSYRRRIGGWGYFLIERDGGFQPGDNVSPMICIDLYLYKEGL